MDKERPFAANYVVGCLIAMSLHMIFNSLAAYLYPEIYDSPLFKGEVAQIIFVITAVWEICLAICIMLRSGLAYRLCLITVPLMFAITVLSMISVEDTTYDAWIQALLAALCIVIMLLPSMRSAYNDWSLPKMPELDV